MAEEYTLTIRAKPSTAPATQRLGMLLKALLRQYGFRCVHVAENAPVDQQCDDNTKNANGDETVRRGSDSPGRADACMPMDPECT
jgi:hypothetical protein